MGRRDQRPYVSTRLSATFTPKLKLVDRTRDSMICLHHLPARPCIRETDRRTGDCVWQSLPGPTPLAMDVLWSAGTTTLSVRAQERGQTDDKFKVRRPELGWQIHFILFRELRHLLIVHASPRPLLLRRRREDQIDTCPTFLFSRLRKLTNSSMALSAVDSVDTHSVIGPLA